MEQSTVPVLETTPPVRKLCPNCWRGLGQTAHCAICRGHRERNERAAVQGAREHIRAAIRQMAALDTTLNAWASDDAFGQPNRATAAIDDLNRALDALAEIAR